jgi:putative ABC transport system permease protein
MRLSDRLRALSVLWSERLRTALTLLGIVVGSGAIVLVAGLVAGAEAALVKTAQSATGSDLVEAGRRDESGEQRARGRPELSRADARALESSWIGSGQEVHAEASRQTRAHSHGRQKRVRLVSGSPTMVGLFRLELGQGRFIDADDLSTRQRVCVVGHEVWTELLARAPLDERPTLVADGVVWNVVGVLKRKPLIGSTDGTHIWDRKVVVPETSFDALYSPEHRVDRILLRTSLSQEIVRRGVFATLLRRHYGAKNFGLDDAAARAQERMILAIVRILLMVIGAVALAVGGVNVMNVMLVTVSERTREIGLRRALGATRASILVQILLESSVQSLAGGVIGVAIASSLVGLSGLVLERVFGHFPAQVVPWAVALGLGLSLLTGLLAGALPALRAAKLYPADALRAE